ncbi:N-acetylmannosamine-6-phosphate 2-epimerase [Streptomyces sp. NPDC058985]|uniref:N-acetylmannosamine-6-phosphate 2-epimerase n=1 Tax=Streptomyces sp. NPDC058985 TaxID=3346684 RepID=UPI0036D0797D
MDQRQSSATSSAATAFPGAQRFLCATAGALVVSCQARPGEPLAKPHHMAAMARTVVLGGAAAVRAEGVDDVAAIRVAVDVPVLGLWKDGHEGVYITPTLRHALAVAQAGADVVALDGTDRPRPDGRTLADTVAELRAAGIAVMADISTAAEGTAAIEAGAQLISTTLSGYTPTSSRQDGPDVALVAELAAAHPGFPVVAEGRYRTPEDAARALKAGAHTVVVGGAITRPLDLTARFAAALAPKDA